jgi:hypothetical protein
VEPEILLLHDHTRQDSKALVVKSSFTVHYSKEVAGDEGEKESEGANAGNYMFNEKAHVKVLDCQAFVSEARKVTPTITQTHNNIIAERRKLADHQAI